METNNKKELYDTCLKYLDISFLSSDLKELLTNNSNFKLLIGKMISIIYYYEENKIIEETNYSRLENAYKTITNKEFELSKFDNENDFDEIVAFFPVLISNSLHKSIEEIENSISQKTVDKKLLTSKEEQKNIEENEVNNFDPNSMMNAMGGFFNASNMNQIADQMMYQAGQVLLNTKIASGEVYKFSTKPKLIPIIKYLISALFILVPILMIASIAILGVMSGKVEIYLNINNKEEVVQLTLFSWTSILNLIVYLLIVGMITYSLIKNNKNENFKYRLNWGSLAIYLFIAWLTIFLQATDSLDPVFHWDNLKNELQDFISKNPDHYDTKAISLFEKYRIIQFVIFGALGTITILVVLGAVFNPKVDNNRMQELLQKYVEDIRSGRVDFDSMGSQRGRFGNGIF